MLKKLLVMLSRNFASECTIKAFDKMPGPSGVFGLGNFYNYLPGVGKYSFDKLHESGLDKYTKFGEIVKEKMVPGVNLVWLFNPTDIAKVFVDGPGNFPCRRSHLALEKYRHDRPHIYRTAGLLPTNGPEWWKIRVELQKGLSSPQNVRNFLPAVDKVILEFIQSFPKFLNHDHSSADFLTELSRLNLELTCLMALDVRMDSFSENERLSGSTCNRLTEAAHDTNISILPTDHGFQMWKYFETPAYRKLRTSQEFIEKLAVDLISQKMSYYSEDDQKLKEKSLLEQYLENPKLDLQDIVGMTSDLLLAGVHTTAFTTSFALFHIANSKDVQDKLYAELVKILPDPKMEVTVNMMNSEFPYTRAVLKETFRLNPISVGVGRILNQDQVLGGYHVPKDTIIVTQNFISCRLEKYFKNPLEFTPDRWLKVDGKKPNFHPFLVLPFGHGVRACIARRFAEQNILMLLIRLLRNYEIDWNSDKKELGVLTKLINQPDGPISLKFKKRT